MSDSILPQWNMMAPTLAAPSTIWHDRWFFSTPTAWRESRRTLRAKKRGVGFVRPKGAKRESAWTFCNVSSPSSTCASTSIWGWKLSSGSVSMYSHKRRENSSSFAVGSVMPTAPPWPPKRVSKSEHDSMALNKFTLPTLRPEPRASSPSMVNRIVGTPYSFTKREATMPFTPSCQPSPPTTSARWPW